eukprot:GSChrysophyteH2.ASY1.ANO1.1428.1 assembled CDS
MLVQLSRSQDIEAGDGTTGICVIAGALLQACAELLSKGIHATLIAEAFKLASAKATEVLTEMAIPVDLGDRDSLLDAVNTYTASNVDLADVKIVKQVGGTMEDSELVNGLVLERGAKHTAGGPTKMKDAKIALIQFCLSAPKTDMENNVVVSDYAAMDRILREERKYLLNLCKKIKKSGCNVLLIQKSILRDGYNDLSLHFLSKLGIMVVTDIERTEKLGSCAECNEITIGIENMGRTVTILMRGSNKLVLDEADRSVHDALCVVRSLVKKRYMIAGGGAPEAECALQLNKWSKTLTGVRSYCARSFAEALEII